MEHSGARTVNKLSCVLFVFIFSSSWSASHHPQDFLRSIAGTPNEGQKIVQHYCANCHAEKPIIPLGAPRMGREIDWKSRIEKGMDTLFKHTDEGMNAMPARGGCFECSDEQLMLAIEALLPKFKKQKTLLK